MSGAWAVARPSWNGSSAGLSTEIDELGRGARPPPLLLDRLDVDLDVAAHDGKRRFETILPSRIARFGGPERSLQRWDRPIHQNSQLRIRVSIVGERGAI